MTVLYVDVSHYDVDRRGRLPEWSLAALSTSGVMIARATYGDPKTYAPATRHFAALLAGAKSDGFKARGGYHNLIHGDAASAARQADWLRRELDAADGNWAMVDVEPYAALQENKLWPRWADVQRFVDQWRKMDSRVLALYLPRWVWSGWLGRPHLGDLGIPLVSSLYGANDNLAPDDLYAARGGDLGDGWASYGGVAPTFWQFGSRCPVPGLSALTDINAYRGSVEQLYSTLGVDVPSYAQLQREPWWTREEVTPEIDWLGDELCKRTNRPRVAFGVKGDRLHVRGAHRSQEWIRHSAFCTNRTYTVQSGLTAAQERHLAGLDFNPGSDVEMIRQCKRIYNAMRAGQLEEVREFYGNVDGDKVVDGFDNLRNRDAASDKSHLWHWHLTLDRRYCRDKALMQRILNVVLGITDHIELGEKDEMADLTKENLYDIGTAVANRPINSGGTMAYAAWNATLSNTTRIVTELVALRTVVESLAETIRAGGGNVETAAILAGVDERVAAAEARLAADARDAVADLGEGGSAQVRGAQ